MSVPPFALGLLLALAACDGVTHKWDWLCKPETLEARTKFVVDCVSAARSGLSSAGDDQDSDDLVYACGRESRRHFCVWHKFAVDEDIP